MYKPYIQYYAHSTVEIGAMDKESSHCKALTLKNESARMCCAPGKVHLRAVDTPAEPLNSLLIDRIKILVSSNEPVWCIFGILIHELDPLVSHLAVHLANRSARMVYERDND